MSVRHQNTYDRPSKKHWLDSAKLLDINQRRKIAHCTNEPTAYIANNLKGYSLYCFRCGEKLFHPVDSRSLKELRAASMAALDGLKQFTGMPPDAIGLEFAPEQALVWLLNGGLTPEVAEHVHGIKWHDASKRLLMPVRDAALKDVGLVARAVNGERPKYKMIQGKPTLHFPIKPNRLVMVLTEDILSAIAVASAGYDAAAILGTSVAPQDTAQLTVLATTIVSFTDPDKAGRDAYVKMRMAFGVHGSRLVRAKADKDPKYLSRDAIREAIDEALRS